MKSKFFKVITTALILSITAMISVGCGNSTEKSADKEIIVSSKEYTENILLGKITYEYLKNNGYKVKDETGLAGQGLIRNSLTSGEIDTYWEYTGTAYMEFMKKDLNTQKPEEVYDEVKVWDKSENQIEWLNHSQLNNTYCFVTTKEVSDKENIKTISDMAKAYNENKDLKFIANPEYFEREDGMPKVYNSYDFEIPEKNKVLLELGMFYNALMSKEGDFTVGFTTDGMIKANDLFVIEDDKDVFPVYYATPVFRSEIIEAHPEIPELMNKLIEKIDTETMMSLNEQVDVDKKPIDDVVHQFLVDNELLK